MQFSIVNCFRGYIFFNLCDIFNFVDFERALRTRVDDHLPAIS